MEDAFGQDSDLPFHLAHRLAQQQQHASSSSSSSAYHQQQQPALLPPAGSLGGVSEDDLYQSWNHFTVNSNAPGGLGASGGGADGQAGQRTSLRVPFFRWFGPTSYTPGIKRYKVELQDEPSEPPTSTSSPPLPTSHLPYSASSTGGPSFDPSPPAHHAYSPQSIHSHSSPEDSSFHRSTASPEDVKRAQEKASHLALFKRGRDRSQPLDSVFERHLDVFFSTLGGHFPFLSKAEILVQHRARSLPALLANSICALAARFVPNPSSATSTTSSAGTGSTSAEEDPFKKALPFEHVAKKLLTNVLSFPSIETCMSLILLAWNEFGSGRDSGIWMFSGLAIRMVQDLGLSHEPSPFHLPSPSERARRRLVFWSVFFLDRVISYGTGRSVTIPETEIDVRGPTEGDCSFFLPTPPLGAGERPPHPWPALIEVARCRGKISDLLNKPGGEGGWGLDRRGEMERLQDEMIGFYQSMSKSLHFSVQSFKMYKEIEWSPPFLFLHMLFHSVITILHRPSLLPNFELGEEVLLEPNVEVSRSSARTLSNMVSYADLVGPIALLANPFADQPIFISAIAFLDERTALSSLYGRRPPTTSSASAAQSAADGLKTPTSHRLLRSFADSKLDVSILSLRNITSHWAGVGWVLRTIDQKKRGFSVEEIDPDVGDFAPSILVPRDPTMVKLWLAQEWRNGQAQAQQMPSTAGAVPGVGGGVGQEGLGGAGWSGEGWDENMMALFPADVGLSFTGQDLTSSHLNLSFEPLGHHYADPSSSLLSDPPSNATDLVPPSALVDPNAFLSNANAHSNGGQQLSFGELDFAMDSNDLPDTFFQDLVWGNGGFGESDFNGQ